MAKWKKQANETRKIRREKKMKIVLCKNVFVTFSPSPFVLILWTEMQAKHKYTHPIHLTKCELYSSVWYIDISTHTRHKFKNVQINRLQSHPTPYTIANIIVCHGKEVKGPCSIIAIIGSWAVLCKHDEHSRQAWWFSPSYWVYNPHANNVHNSEGSIIMVLYFIISPFSLYFLPFLLLLYLSPRSHLFQFGFSFLAFKSMYLIVLDVYVFNNIFIFICKIHISFPYYDQCWMFCSFFLLLIAQFCFGYIKQITTKTFCIQIPFSVVTKFYWCIIWLLFTRINALIVLFFLFLRTESILWFIFVLKNFVCFFVFKKMRETNFFGRIQCVTKLITLSITEGEKYLKCLA